MVWSGWGRPGSVVVIWPVASPVYQVNCWAAALMVTAKPRMSTVKIWVVGASV